MQGDTLHGEIFLEEDENTPPVYDLEEVEDEFETVVYENSGDANKSLSGDGNYERTLARWRDITSPPHTRKKCAKWARADFPPVKICVGWKIQYRWVYNKAILKVRIANENDIKKAVEDCLKVSAVAAAIAAIASGGSAAYAAAEAALKACLISKFADEAVSVSIRTKSSRGGWE